MDLADSGRAQRGLARQYRRRRRPNTDLVRKSQPKYTYDPPLTLKTSGVVLTSYFSNMEDPLYQVTAPLHHQKHRSCRMILCSGMAASAAHQLAVVRPQQPAHARLTMQAWLPV